MRTYPVAGILAATACLLCGASVGQDRSSTLGVFEGQSDIGSVVPPGTGRYDPGKAIYTLTAAGANTWYRVDDFHYVWKKAVGDLAIAADIAFRLTLIVTSRIPTARDCSCSARRSTPVESMSMSVFTGRA